MSTTNDTIALLHPLWPAASNIIAGVTTRQHVADAADESCGSRVDDGFNTYGHFNLAEHVGDDPAQVRSNRKALDEFLTHRFFDRSNAFENLQWQWLNQTHSNRALQFHDLPSQSQAVAAEPAEPAEPADAIWTDQANSVCAVLTADCLPILLCTHDGDTVAAIHAGWRGILNGVISNTIASLVDNSHRASKIYAWLGPAIGPNQFEVGEDVFDLFQQSPLANEPYKDALQQAFVPKHRSESRAENKFLADLYQLGTIALRQCGVHGIYGGGFCTYNDAKRFYSYRRDGVTGRQLSFIFRKEV